MIPAALLYPRQKLLLPVPISSIPAAHVGLPLVLVYLVAGVLFDALALVQLRQPIRVLELAAEDAVAPEQIEVDPDKRRYYRGEEPHVDGEEARERRGPHHVAPHEEVDHVPPDERRVGSDLHAHNRSPEPVLVPPEQIPGKGEPDDEEEQHDADDPVELPGRLVPAGE